MTNDKPSAMFTTDDGRTYDLNTGQSGTCPVCGKTPSNIEYHEVSDGPWNVRIPVRLHCADEGSPDHLDYWRARRSR
jgi:hypothetical protein